MCNFKILFTWIAPSFAFQLAIIPIRYPVIPTDRIVIESAKAIADPTGTNNPLGVT